MATEIKDLDIDRVSLVKKPANKRPFLLFKEEDMGDENLIEFMKDLHDHLDAAMDIVEADMDEKAAAQKIADLMMDGGEEAISRATNFISNLRYMHSMLSGLYKSEIEWDEGDFTKAVEAGLADELGVEKAELTGERRGKLPKRSFAWVDANGKGHFPIHDASHVRNALARFNQGDFPDAATKTKALRKILAAARRLGVKYDRGKFAGMLSKEDLETLDKMAGEYGTVRASDKDREAKDMTTQVEDKDKTQAPAGDPTPVAKGDEDKVTLSKAEFDKLQGDAAKGKVDETVRKQLEEDVRVLKEKENTRVYLEKAAKYPDLGIPQAELAEMIRKMEVGGYKTEDVDKHFGAMNAQLKESNLLKSMGAGGDGDSAGGAGEPVRKGATEFEVEVEKRARAIISKGDDKRTPERIRADVARVVADERPDLYEQHREDLRKR